MTDAAGIVAAICAELDAATLAVDADVLAFVSDLRGERLVVPAA